MGEMPTQRSGAQIVFQVEKTASPSVQQWEFLEWKGQCDWSLEREEERVGNEDGKGRLGKEWRCYSDGTGKPLEDWKQQSKYKSLTYMVRKITHYSVENRLSGGEWKHWGQ